MKELALKRYLQEPIDEDLATKMVFVSGPRQVGKTTLALSLVGAADQRHPAYLNWDDVSTLYPVALALRCRSRTCARISRWPTTPSNAG